MLKSNYQLSVSDHNHYHPMSESHIIGNQRVWLITGGSSGFSLEVTKVVLKKGDIAVTTYRPPNIPESLAMVQASLLSSQSSNLLLLPLDLASSSPSDSQVSDVFSKAITHFGRIDVVFNNVGFTTLGEIEGIPEENARRMFDINFWGMARVSREAVKVFRDVNPEMGGGRIGGRLLNVSSRAGVVPNAGLGYYSASKQALEGFTEALVMEVDPAWNIKITILEPSAFRTHAVNSSLITFPQHPAYTSNPSLPSHFIRKWFANHNDITGDPMFAAEQIYKFSSWDEQEGEVPLRLQLGDDSWTGIRDRLKSMLKEQERVEGWSKGLVPLGKGFEF
ncbi:NAD(P)-binding protein [Gymnopus androsaceus JB14]|uniref:NAD(P)-binding protein n=1 Tax=Gymnopus androsaceus JB14 TaxID=1447944 RepID=A0A6A4HF52_9AGAR|nr:NAD(P)-binding protein [Gymnopus androsaceus JB14]